MRDAASVVSDFHEVVNMEPEELEQWLGTRESQSVGMTRPGESESQGHKSGRQILELLQRERERGGPLPAEQYSEDDLREMARVVSYVRRHMAQRHRLSAQSAEEVGASRWASSLRNWGHDPLHDEGEGEREEDATNDHV